MILLAEHKPIKTGLNRLLKTDPVFSRLDKTTLTLYSREKRAGDFAAMIGAILGQQVSIAAARAMWTRLLAACADDVSPQNLMRLSDEELRACGFSRQKIVYARGLAEAVLDGSFAPAGLEAMSDDEVIAAITRLKGFGVWSAQMYLIFSLARADVWPVGDLGVVIGAQHYLGSDERPGLQDMEALGTRFAGHRTAAALLLWELKAVREAEAKLATGKAAKRPKA